MNPPAPVVKSTTVATSKGSIQSITVTFTEAMTTSSADNRKDYALVDAGSSHIFGGKGNTGVTIKSVTYSSANDSVKLTLAKPVRTSDSLRLTINAQPPSGLQGANGQFLNEACQRQAGRELRHVPRRSAEDHAAQGPHEDGHEGRDEPRRTRGSNGGRSRRPLPTGTLGEHGRRAAGNGGDRCPSGANRRDRVKHAGCDDGSFRTQSFRTRTRDGNDA